MSDIHSILQTRDSSPMEKKIYTTPICETQPLVTGDVMDGVVTSVKAKKGDKDLGFKYGGGGTGEAYSGSPIWDDETE